MKKASQVRARKRSLSQEGTSSLQTERNRGEGWRQPGGAEPGPPGLLGPW
jgi:hypothetical protein